ncbi:MAG: circadian clock protein KaiC [Methanocella sp. PtaU1.Bin125]|nr:MAG: circadian clock protein KaiC [Methanocella sp. PtaU1.Bin125]
MEERVKSGVPGLDDILGGGLFRGQTYGITGGPGAGKSILSMEFLVRGAERGERGLYVTSEVPADKLARQIPFGSLQGHIDNGDLIVFSTRPLPGEVTTNTEKFDLAGLTYMVKHYVRNNDIKRVVFDSVNAFVQQYDDRRPLRRELNNLVAMLESYGCTTLLVFEGDSATSDPSVEFLVDGVIELGRIETHQDVVRYAQVRKMRGTAHDLNKRAMEIGEQGILITNIKPFYGD